MEKNDRFNGIVTDINDDGDGVIKTNGEVIFVPNVWLDENIDGIVINTKSKYNIGKCINVIKPSPDRVQPPCPYFKSCGGCSLQHVATKKQLEFKKNKVKHIFKKVASLDIEPEEVVASNSLRYRNKISLPVNENIEIGLYRKNTHNVLDIEDCLISKEWTKPLINCVKEYMTENKISGFSDKTKTGLVKHIVAREVSGAILITIVINGNSLPHSDALIQKLSKSFDNFGLNININKLNNNVILTDNFVHIFGLRELTAQDHGLTYPVTNASFLQVNEEIANKIYDIVDSFIEKSDVVVNAYSGAGLLTARLSRKAKTAYGIEIIKEASDSADSLAKLNNIVNMINICGDCTKELPNLLNKGIKNHTIVVDPPRKGCTTPVLESMIKSQPKKIIYVSCNPNTLARDVKYILDNSDFKLSKVIPFDMFPNTSHVESVAVLSVSTL